MVDFYSKLGFEVFRTALLEDRKIRLDMLRHREEEAYLEFSSPLPQESTSQLREKEKTRTEDTSGLAHVAFSVENIEAEFSHLRGIGLDFEVSPKTGKFGRFAFTRDPEGNLVELIEWH